MNNTAIYNTYQEAKVNRKTWIEDGVTKQQFPPYHDYINGVDYGDMNPQVDSLGIMINGK